MSTPFMCFPFLIVCSKCILVIVEVRRLYPAFPLRPFLPQLVQALQDTDGAVRDCARKSIIEIFTGMGVSDGARADLKREMERVGIRKATMGEILGEVIGKPAAAPMAESQIPLPASRIPSSRIIGTLKDSTERQPDRPETPAAAPGPDPDIAPVYVSFFLLRISPHLYGIFQIASFKDLEHEFQKMSVYFQASLLAEFRPTCRSQSCRTKKRNTTGLIESVP